MAFRDEMTYLPGMLRNLERHVDGLVALDDGSTDGSGDVVGRHRLTLEVIRLDRGADTSHDDYLLHSTLIRAAWKYQMQWLLGVDADERLAGDFRSQVLRVTHGGARSPSSAFWVPIREMWTTRAYRFDGIWGTKKSSRLFRSDPDHTFDKRALHGLWPSVSTKSSSWPLLDSSIYHLRMMTPAGRKMRHAKYQRLDPDKQAQSFGYDYFLDETDLTLRELPRRDRKHLYAPIG